MIDVIFGEFLGLDYTIEFKENAPEWKVELENGGKIIIEDHFFSKFQNDLEYLKINNIPNFIKYQSKDNNPFILENDIPIIYGEDKLIIDRNSKAIVCGIDIFASSFFMLTRWEEYVNKKRDNHNRFPASESLAYKFGFLNRPLVNEYVEMLWNMIKFLGFMGKRKEKKFSLVLTHDVDSARKYSKITTGAREIVGDLLKRKNIGSAYKNITTKLGVYFGLRKDPYDTFEYLMDISEKYNTKSYFFLHSSNSSKYDINNDKHLKKVAEKIIRRGHFLGYHPSYDAYNNPEIFKRDKEKIEKLINLKLTFGRQHFLRFEVPITLQIWEDNNMEWDSTLSYADKEGFRCGVCYPFSVFNFLTRKKLKLKERPLIVMEGSLVNYQKLSPQEAYENIVDLARKVKKYKGEFVILWHNSSFHGIWEQYAWVYEKVIENIFF